MAGKDYVGEYFGAIYDPIAQQIVIAWQKLVMALGGVTQGLTVTANNFITADWHSKHGAGPVSGTKPVPKFQNFTYHRPASASGSGYLDYRSLGDQIAWDIVFPTILKAFPRGHQDRLHLAAAQWRQAANAVSTLSRQVNQVINSITVDPKVTASPQGVARRVTPGIVRTWQEEMQTFCSRIWGTAAWDGPNADPAPLHVLGNASSVLADACDKHATAIDVTRSKLERRMGAAAFAAVLGAVLSGTTGGISAVVAAQFDTKMVADCIHILVTDYYQPVETLKAALAGAELQDQLEHASARTPTLQAMEAKAESVGDRALHDFRYPGLNNADAPGKASQGRPVPGASPYAIDLAGQEGTEGAHVINKHVGMTNTQLTDRLAHEPNVSASSSFNNLDDAQRHVQSAIDSPLGRERIERMIAQGKPGTQITYDAQETVGRSVDHNGNVTKVDSVFLAIKRVPALDPPFVVYTAYPVP
ncbi:RNase A-like domain-containing protein [Actinomadura algeriensis]|uniref:Bacterial CdiA-CT RNAse A domain-containing protein n=1 Tax=Actinomadura algeriensis TaxID=1679523 RepID=A0ABR9JPR8_9ACTN|nr:RNase A-like domain-containing protein [Actinomadura algeriensis]MBE1532565.1 hypothetical protein [Actinomadura algeriensis]